MKSMADHNNNNNKRNNNTNCSNNLNYSRDRGNVSCETKKLIRCSTIKPSSSSGATGNAGGSVNRTERCVLCLDEKRSPVRITCGHSFCNECLDVYKSYQKYAWATRCPICRGSLKEKRRSVKRKHSEENIATTTARTRPMTGSNGGPSRMRLSATAAPVETATTTTAVATATATVTATTTVTTEITADASAEQIYLLEEFMAIASDTDVFGLSSDMTFGNTGSVSTPTNSVSTVSASEAEEEDMEVAVLEGAVDVDARFEESDFASDLGEEEVEDGDGLEEYEDEVFDEDVDLDEGEERQIEDDADEEEQNDGNEDEDDDAYYFEEFDDESNEEPENYDYDTVDEEDPDDDAGDDSNEQLQDDDYYAEEQESESDVVVVDEVIIID